MSEYVLVKVGIYEGMVLRIEDTANGRYVLSTSDGNTRQIDANKVSEDQSEIIEYLLNKVNKLSIAIENAAQRHPDDAELHRAAEEI